MTMTYEIRRAALAACLAVLAVPALASAPSRTGDAVQAARMVKYSDVELASTQGRRSLAFHIRTTATIVCAGDGAMVPKGPDYLSCREADPDRGPTTFNAPAPTPLRGSLALLRAERPPIPPFG